MSVGEVGEKRNGRRILFPFPSGSNSGSHPHYTLRKDLLGLIGTKTS